MIEDSKTLDAAESRKPAYETPRLTELASLAELTLGGAPSTGLDTQNCTTGASQNPPTNCF